MNTVNIFAFAFILCVATKVSAVTPGALAVVGFEKGESPRLAFVALEPIVAGERMELLGGAEDSDCQEVLASIRFTRNVARGEIIQLAGSYCSAGSVVYDAPQRQLASSRLIRVLSYDIEVCRTTPWMAALGPNAAYVGTRNHGSIPLAWSSLLSRENWRAGRIPPQDDFKISASVWKEASR